MIYLKNLENNQNLGQYERDLKNRNSDVNMLEEILKLNKIRKEKIHAIEKKKMNKQSGVHRLLWKKRIRKK